MYAWNMESRKTVRNLNRIMQRIKSIIISALVNTMIMSAVTMCVYMHNVTIVWSVDSLVYIQLKCFNQNIFIGR